MGYDSSGHHFSLHKRGVHCPGWLLAREDLSGKSPLNNSTADSSPSACKRAGFALTYPCPAWLRARKFAILAPRKLAEHAISGFAVDHRGRCDLC
jgi:hypothetical protein